MTVYKAFRNFYVFLISLAIAAGAAAGGRTGLTALTTAVLFLLSMFLAPIFIAIPAYLCVIAMPLFYSISEGIAIGVISYVVINAACKKFKEINPIMYILAALFILKYIFL